MFNNGGASSVGLDRKPMGHNGFGDHAYNNGHSPGQQDHWGNTVEARVVLKKEMTLHTWKVEARPRLPAQPNREIEGTESDYEYKVEIYNRKHLYQDEQRAIANLKAERHGGGDGYGYGSNGGADELLQDADFTVIQGLLINRPAMSNKCARQRGFVDSNYGDRHAHPREMNASTETEEIEEMYMQGDRITGVPREINRCPSNCKTRSCQNKHICQITKREWCQVQNSRRTIEQVMRTGPKIREGIVKRVTRACETEKCTLLTLPFEILRLIAHLTAVKETEACLRERFGIGAALITSDPTKELRPSNYRVCNYRTIDKTHEDMKFWCPIVSRAMQSIAVTLGTSATMYNSKVHGFESELGPMIGEQTQEKETVHTAATNALLDKQCIQLNIKTDSIRAVDLHKRHSSRKGERNTHKGLTSRAEKHGGAVLFQEQADGVEIPTYFTSKTFTKEQRNWSATERELWSLMYFAT